MDNKLSKPQKILRFCLRQLVPNVGTVLAVALMLFVYSAQAAPNANSVAVSGAVNATPGVIPYQGMLTDGAGNPVTGSVNIVFKLYDVNTGGTAKWVETYSGANAVNVTNGVFNVLLGSITAFQQTDLSSYPLYLEITVGSDAPMTPREMIGSAPNAVTVPDGSINTAKIADGSITPQKAPFASQHFIGPNGPVSNSKVMTGTYIARIPGGTLTESISIDITQLGYVNTPVGIAQVVDFALDPPGAMNTNLILAHYDHSLIGSTNTTAKITVFRSDNQPLLPGYVRIELILWND